MRIITILIMIVISLSGWTDTQIANAIYKAENSVKYPYGIKSIDTKGDKDYARRICLNTIKNNRKRFSDYGYKQYNTYLEFLASRYCPVGCEDDNGTNQYWLSNVLYFLNKDSK